MVLECVLLLAGAGGGGAVSTAAATPPHHAHQVKVSLSSPFQFKDDRYAYIGQFSVIICIYKINK